MIPEWVIRAALVGEAVVLAVATVVFLGHGLLLHRRQLRHREPIDQARRALVALLDPAGDGQGTGPLASLPVAVQSRLLAELVPSLGGSHRRALAGLAGRLGIEDRLRRRLGSRWWRRRLEAAHLMALLSEDVEAMTRLLGDPHPAVRAQAIEWLGDHADEAGVELLVERLGDPSPLCRSVALDSLLRAGARAVPAVRRGLARPGVAPTLLDVAAWRPDPSYLELVRDLAGSDQAEVRVGAARALGALGGDAGVGALELLLDDTDPRVRAAAAAAVGRLGHWPAGPALVRRLDDAGWEVRLAATEALVELGAPGQVLLAQQSRRGEPRAAEMARLGLALASLKDLPAVARSGPDGEP